MVGLAFVLCPTKIQLFLSSMNGWVTFGLGIQPEFIFNHLISERKDERKSALKQSEAKTFSLTLKYISKQLSNAVVIIYMLLFI